MVKKGGKPARGGAKRAHSRMRRRFVAGLLAAVLFVTGAVGVGPLSGGPQVVRADEDDEDKGTVAKVTGKVLNGIKAYGKESAVDAMLEVGNAIDEGTGTNAGSEITGFIYSYVLEKNSTASKLDKITVLCEGILDEISETQNLIQDTATRTDAMIAGSDLDTAMTNMDNEWKSSVTNIINGSSNKKSYDFDNPMKKYEAYLKAARSYRKNNASKEKVDSAEAEFHSALASAYSSSGSGGDKAIQDMLTDTDGRMNGAMIATLQALIDKLDPVEGGDNYVDKAAKLAYKKYAFSQDQYRLITGEMDKWIEEITKFEMMYEEYLAWQGRYLKEHGETELLTNTYPGYLTTLAATNVNFQDELAAMLGRDITMSNTPSIKLRYAQFFKPEDAGARKDASQKSGWTAEQTFSMCSSGYHSSIDSSYYKEKKYKNDECDTTSQHDKSETYESFYRVGVVKNGGVDLYGILDKKMPLNNLDWNNNKSFGADQHLMSCDWANFTNQYYMGKQYFSTVGRDSLSKLTDIFGNSGVMALSGNTPAEYLSPYVKSGSVLYALLSDFDIRHKSTGTTGYTDFYGLRLDSQNAGTSFSADKLEGDKVQKISNQYYTLLTRITDTKNAPTVTIKYGREEERTAGSLMEVKLSPARGYRVASLKWIRHDKMNPDAAKDVEEVILDDDAARNLVADENGDIYMNIPVPYTDATLEMKTTADTDHQYVNVDNAVDPNYPDTEKTGKASVYQGYSVMPGTQLMLKINLQPGYLMKDVTLVRHTAGGDVTETLLDQETIAQMENMWGHTTTLGDSSIERFAQWYFAAPDTDATVHYELMEDAKYELSFICTPNDGVAYKNVYIDGELWKNIVDNSSDKETYTARVPAGKRKLEFYVRVYPGDCTKYGPYVPSSLKIIQHKSSGDETQTIFGPDDVGSLEWVNDDSSKKVDPYDVKADRYTWIETEVDVEADTEVKFTQVKSKTKTSGKVDYQKSGEGEATATGVKDKDIKKLEIPDTVVIEGETLKVTSIDPKAFKDLEKLEEVILGKHIEAIGKKAFHGAKRLKTLKILSKKLKKAKVMAALHGSEIEDLTVPKSVLKKYKKFLTKAHTRAKHDLSVDTDEDE